MKIRLAKVSDAEGIAYVGVKTWQTNYRGIFPDEHLDKLSIEENTERWKNMLIKNKTLDNSEVIIAEDSEGRIIGFASGGTYETIHQSYDCEIRAIYVLKECQGKGVGTDLVKKMVEFFISKSWKSMIIWTLKENFQKGFYEKFGGVPKEEQPYEKWGEKYDLVGYVWDDIERIQLDV